MRVWARMMNEFWYNGKMIGTKSTRPSFGTNGGVTLNFGDCTIFGLRAQPNSSGNLSWAGNNTLVKTDQAIEYSVQNAESAVPRGKICSSAVVTCVCVPKRHVTLPSR